MKTAILCVLVVLCAEGCSSIASSSPPPDLSASQVTQFTEVSWPSTLAPEAGWVRSDFVLGSPPSITSFGGRGTTVDIPSREGDSLVGLSYAASGDGLVGARVLVFAFTASGRTDALAEVFDRQRPPGFASVALPLKVPHVMAPGEGLVLQVADADGLSVGYQISAVQATWTRPQ